MKQHIGTYETEAEYTQKAQLYNPFVAFVKDYDGKGNSMAHFSSEYKFAEESGAFDAYSGLLTSLLERVTELEKGGSNIYLFETEYNKLVNGEEAIDENGELIEVPYDASGYTFYVMEDSASTQDKDSKGSVPDGSSTIVITNAVVNEDTHTLVLTGGKIEDGVLIFTSTQSSGDITVDPDKKALVTSSQVTDNTLILTNSTIDDSTLKI